MTKDSIPPAETIKPQSLDPWFLDLLACPACPQRLSLHLDAPASALICDCGRYSYPISADGIPDLLIDSATVLDPSAHPEGADPAELPIPVNAPVSAETK